MKEKIKKIAIVVAWCLLVTGVLVTLGFVNKAQEKVLCKDLEINIAKQEDLFFIEQADIKHLLRQRGDTILNQPLESVDVYDIEKNINSEAAVANAEVYVSGDGVLKIDIVQRRPVVRIYNGDGESYYIDTEGRLMPLSEKYTSKTLIANGFLNEPYAKRYTYSIADIKNNDFEEKQSILDDIFEIAVFIGSDKFWKAQIKQLYVNEKGDIELVPIVGNHRIIFGNASDTEKKFSKLKIFYEEGLRSTGWWDHYSVINLKFDRQIVCTKK